MVKKLVGFRVDEEKWKGFHRLVTDSDETVQRVITNFVDACIAAESVDVVPVGVGKSGRELSFELRLRDTIRQFRDSMEEQNYTEAEFRFSDLVNEIRRIHDATLLEEARSVAETYLKWAGDKRKSRRNHESGNE